MDSRAAGQQPISSHTTAHSMAAPEEGSTAGIQMPQHIDFYFSFSPRVKIIIMIIY